MSNFSEKYGTTVYTDVDGDLMEVSGESDGVYVYLPENGVIVSNGDLVELFEKMSTHADMPGTFVPITDSEVIEETGGIYVCGTGNSAVSVIHSKTTPENLRQTAANLLAIAKRIVDDNREKGHHDALRSSEIALEALELYKSRHGSFESYRTWDDTNYGAGSSDSTVELWIKQAERKREERLPKVGDLVRVAADAKTHGGGKVFFEGPVLGIVAGNYGPDITVDNLNPDTGPDQQHVGPKYITRIAPADELPTLREAVLLGLDYVSLTGQQKYLVNLMVEKNQEK